MTKKPNEHGASCLYSVPLFQSLTREQKDHLHTYVQHKQFMRGETIYRPGEVADSLYVLNTGKVRIYRLSETGKEQVIRILMPGDFTGELALFKQGFYEAFAEALEDTSFCTIRHHDFRHLLLEYPAISVEMLTILAGRLGTSEQQTAWVTTETVRGRLIHFLLSSAEATETQPIVYLKMSKKNLASYLGTTSESLSRELTRLEREGAIKEVAYGEIKLLDLNEKNP